MKKIGFYLFAIFSILIGLYPLVYFIINPKFGLLNTKPIELFENQIWYLAFYLHILLGGVALLTGWSQFIRKIRLRRLSLHRTLGKIYLLSVLGSGVSALYIAQYATGNSTTGLGFSVLAILWLFSTLCAYTAIRKGKIALHERWMVYSFALTWAAVMLRVWLPLLVWMHEGAFLPAYQIVAWLCWIPNLIIAYFITLKMKPN